MLVPNRSGLDKIVNAQEPKEIGTMFFKPFSRKLLLRILKETFQTLCPLYTNHLLQSNVADSFITLLNKVR